MGNARARGAYEERKAQAIAAGRVKTTRVDREPSSLRSGVSGGVDLAVLAALLRQRRLVRRRP